MDERKSLQARAKTRGIKANQSNEQLRMQLSGKVSSQYRKNFTRKTSPLSKSKSKSNSRSNSGSRRSSNSSLSNSPYLRKTLIGSIINRIATSDLSISPHISTLSNYLEYNYEKIQKQCNINLKGDYNESFKKVKRFIENNKVSDVARKLTELLTMTKRSTQQNIDKLVTEINRLVADSGNTFAISPAYKSKLPKKIAQNLK
jgi:cysteinyl-tRNA synthetase